MSTPTTTPLTAVKSAPNHIRIVPLLVDAAPARGTKRDRTDVTFKPSQTKTVIEFTHVMNSQAVHYENKVIPNAPNDDGDLQFLRVKAQLEEFQERVKKLKPIPYFGRPPTESHIQINISMIIEIEK